MPAQLTDPALEVKFNPYHDPRNGQLTFAPGGVSNSAAEMTRPPKRPARPPGREDARILADEKRLREQSRANDPRNPANYGVYKVRTGDTLTHIAATRVGVTTADLMWLNGLTSDRLRIGQEVKLPHQAFLDRSKRALDTIVALSSYMRTHGGQLPPNVARPPSLFEQKFGPGRRHIERNGYAFELDPQGRTRTVSGVIWLNPDQTRSRASQAGAGRPDRLPTDEGGHYVARRFDGPTDAFNHFAQNRSFNRGRYRRLENRWAAATGRGERVSVVIVPQYSDGSNRPYEIDVSWTVAGVTRRGSFQNQAEVTP